MLVDPYNFTNYNRTDRELEAMLLFSIAVAGKTAYIIADKIERLLSQSHHLSPFATIEHLIREKRLDECLKECKMGKYRLLVKAFDYLIKSGINLRTCTVEELEVIPGVGSKTARMFLLHSRKNQRVAVLDTHILKFLKTLGHDIPRTTPTGKKYHELEKIFIDYADKQKHSIADLDLLIWKKYAKKRNSTISR